MNLRYTLLYPPFLCFAIALTGLLASACAGVGQAAPDGVPSALDPVTGRTHSRRLASGVPLGGVGTGTFQLLTDGAISRAAITNNWQQPTGDLPGCFAAVWTRTAGRTQARVLALTSSCGLPTVKSLEYDGQPPAAILTYADPALPVSVLLRAFSPLIPFDIKNSSMPAAAFVFQLRNKSAETVEISLALSWENILGTGGTAARGAWHDRTGGTIAALPSASGIFGLHFTGPPLAPGNSAEERLQDNTTGDMALLVMPPRRESQVTQAGWNALDAAPGWWESFAQTGDVSGSVPAGVEGKIHTAGVVTVRLTLKPNGFAEIPFAVAWHTPHYYTLSGVDYGHYDALLYPDAPSAGRALLTEWRSLFALTQEWQQALRFSNLPAWLTRRLMNSVTPLQTNTLHTEDGRFALIRSAGSPGGSQVIGPEQAPAMNALLSDFFPGLKMQTVQPGITTAQTGQNAFIDSEYSLSLPPPDAREGGKAATPIAGLAKEIADAVALIAAGKPDEGVAALQKLDESRNNTFLSPWTAPEDMTANPPFAASLAQAGDWAVLNALNGCAYDPAASRLTITPRIPGTWRSLIAPVFDPTFRARIEYRPRAHGGLLTFRLDRLIAPASPASASRPAVGAQFVIASLRVPGPPSSDKSPLTVHVSLLQTPLGCRIAVDPASGDLILTLDTPLALAAGDRLEIEVH